MPATRRTRSTQDIRHSPIPPPSNPRKRVLSPSRDKTTQVSPKAKRARFEKPKSTAKPKSKVDAPPFNPLPSLPEVPRPALHLFIWGASDSGQLGLGENYVNGVARPTKHPWAERSIDDGTFGTDPGAGLVSIASGGMHTLLLDENGVVWSCGSNDEGALGRTLKKNSSEDSLSKAQEFSALKTLQDDNFRAVRLCAGDNFGAALNDQGELKLWGTFRGDDGHSQFSASTEKQFLPTSISLPSIPHPTKISSISGGENHLVALSTDGSVYTWGNSQSGQLGRPIRSGHEPEALLPTKIFLGSRARKITYIGTGLRTTFAIDQDGEVWGWGSNTRGQLGNGSAGDLVLQPTKIPALSPKELSTSSEERIIQISGGEFHTLFLSSAGNVYASGACDDYQLGLPEDHEIFQGKQLKDIGSVPYPILVPFPESTRGDPVVSISCGLRFNMAITKAGVLLSWGLGVQDELGLPGGVESAVTPQVVVRKEGKWATMNVSCGGQHVVGLLRKREDN